MRRTATTMTGTIKLLFAMDDVRAAYATGRRRPPDRGASETASEFGRLRCRPATRRSYHPWFFLFPTEISESTCGSLPTE